MYVGLTFDCYGYICDKGYMNAREIFTELSEKPRLGKILTEKVPVWKKAAANDCRVRENYEISVQRASRDRFTAKDPIGFGGGQTNLFAYVLNDPITFIDPLGLWECAPGVNCDFSQQLNDSLTCMDNCMGSEFTITSGRRGDPTRNPTNHSQGQACDIGEGTNPGIDRGDFEACYSQCFPTGSYGQRECNSDGVGTHYHLQTNEGRGRTHQPYFRPGTVGHTNHDQ